MGEQVKRGGAIFLSAIFFIFYLPIGRAGDISKEVDKRLETAAKKLDLTPDQVEKLRPVLNKELSEMRRVRQEYTSSGKSGASRENAAEAIRQIRAASDQQVKQILMADQVEQWREMEGRRKGRPKVAWE